MSAVGSALITGLTDALGYLGWVLVATLFVVAGVLSPVVVRWAAANRPLTA